MLVVDCRDEDKDSVKVVAAFSVVPESEEKKTKGWMDCSEILEEACSFCTLGFRPMILFGAFATILGCATATSSPCRICTEGFSGITYGLLVFCCARGFTSSKVPLEGSTGASDRRLRTENSIAAPATQSTISKGRRRSCQMERSVSSMNVVLDIVLQESFVEVVSKWG